MLKVVGASWTQIRISTWIIGAVIALGIVAIILGETGGPAEDGNYSATAYWSDESGFRVEFWGQGSDFNNVPKGVARAYYQPHLNTTGWAILEIETQSEYPDWVQAFAAGILEGSLSWQMIHWQWKNTVESTCEGREEFCSKVSEYLVSNKEWVTMEAKTKESDPFWHQVSLFYMQLIGIENGFNMGVRRSRQDVDEIPTLDFLWLNIASDLVDLETKFQNPFREPEKKKTSKEVQDDRFNSVLLNKLTKRSIEDAVDANRVGGYEKDRFDCGFEGITMCSAFIKLVEDKRELFIAHNSAGRYSSMLKMLKRYKLGYHTTEHEDELVPGQSISFSSYPGSIHSMDDFYIISNNETHHKLVITGTPITIYNDDLWDLNMEAEGQVLEGPRVTAASRLATGGRSWSETVVQKNSGTANKQWNVVDVGAFEAIARDEEKYLDALGQLQDLLWVVEQIPGGFAMGDESAILKKSSYWASYGLPFYQNISEISGVEDMYSAHGDAFSYDNTPLARIFRRDEKNATNMSAVMSLMRSNAYKVDPLTNGNPRCAIGSRGDIRADSLEPQPVGTTDLKVYGSRTIPQPKILPPQVYRASLKDLQDPWQGRGQFHGIAGPAHDKDRFPEDTEPFDWLNSDFANVSHVGHPDTWSFQPITLNWS